MLLFKFHRCKLAFKAISSRLPGSHLALACLNSEKGTKTRISNITEAHLFFYFLARVIVISAALLWRDPYWGDLCVAENLCDKRVTLQQRDFSRYWLFSDVRSDFLVSTSIVTRLLPDLSKEFWLISLGSQFTNWLIFWPFCENDNVTKWRKNCPFRRMADFVNGMQRHQIMSIATQF